MTRLHTETLAQLTTAFRTWTSCDTVRIDSTSTIQLVYVALAELQDRRKLDTALIGVVNAAKVTVDRALEEHQVSTAFELAMAKLELALLDLDELRAPVPSPAAAPADASDLVPSL